MAAYLIVCIDVVDADAYRDYQRLVPAHIAAHGGRYIVRGGTLAIAEGSWPPGRLVVVEFPTRDDAAAFIDDPDYAPVAKIRHDTTISHLALVDGIAEADPARPGSAYIVANIKVTDAERYGDYAAPVPAIIADAGGRYLARGGASVAVEGDWPVDRLVIAEFADLAALRAFYDGAAYAAVRPIRQAASQSNVVFVEGFADAP